MAKKRELSVLFPKETLEVGDREITLKPFAWKDFERVTEIVAQYAEVISANSNSLEIVRAILGNAEHGVLKDVAELVRMSTDVEADWLQECSYDQVVGLFAEVVGANISFFSQLGDVLAQKVSPAKPAKTPQEKGGFAPGTGSSAGDTAPAT